MRILVILALAFGVTGQAPATGPAPSAREMETQRLITEYQYGDADAAVDGLCKLRPAAEELPRRLGPTSAFDALLRTEVGMCLGTFGKYALSAPLVPSHPIGLNGMFDLNSFMAYREIQSRDVPIPVLRDWYVVTVSYCLRGGLDCAAVLAAAAERDFEGDADILLLTGSVAEAHGEWSDAENRLRRALAASPVRVEARLRLGRVLQALGRGSEARQQLELAVREARSSQHDFSLHFGLLSLADLDVAAQRTTSARALRREAATIAPFDAVAKAWTKGLDSWAAYRCAQLWEIPERIAAMRHVVLGR